MIASANFLPMCLLICLWLLIDHRSILNQCLIISLINHIRTFIWSWTIMCVQSRFASLRPRSIVIALNRWSFVPIIVVDEYIACYCCSTNSALDKVSVLLTWTASTVDVLLSCSHSEQRAVIIVMLEFFSVFIG